MGQTDYQLSVNGVEYSLAPGVRVSFNVSVGRTLNYEVVNYCVLSFQQVQIAFQRSSFPTTIIDRCDFFPVLPPAPSAVQNITLTEKPSATENFFNETHNQIIIHIRFSWARPVVPFGSVQHYEAWIGDTPATSMTIPNQPRIQVSVRR